MMKAAKWFGQAARLGNPSAQYRMGKCYDEGQGVLMDHEKAYQCYCESAAHGSVQGLTEVGICLATGKGVEKNPELAFQCFQKASEPQNYPGALLNLAQCYELGFGTAKNLKEAKRLQKIAAEVAEALENA